MDIQTIINDRPMTAVQVLIVFLCFVLNMIDGMDVVVASYVAPRIIEEWSVTTHAFGLVFSAALFGMAIGAMCVSPYTDVIGRRNMILVCILVVSVGMMLTAYADSITQLAVLRLLTGLGIGSMLASLTSLAYEYAPVRRRNIVIGIVLGGYPVGATLTGMLAAWLIPEAGWRSMFYVGSAVSLLMLPVIWLFLPESLEFLITKQPPDALARINSILQRLRLQPLVKLPDSPALQQGPSYHGLPLVGVRSLLTADRYSSTLKLWSAFFMAFFTLYFLLSWVPKIAEGSGLTPAQGSYAGAVFNLGSFFGIVFLGQVSNYFGLKRTIFAFMIFSAVVMIIFGALRFSLPIFMFVLFMLGFFVQGGFIGLYTVAARLYPVQIRTTGVGWGIGLGRFGAIIAPALGGLAISLELPVAYIFGLFALPLIIAAYAQAGINNSNVD